MELFIIGFLLFIVFVIGYVFYRAIRIGNRAHQSLENWLKSKP
jgi:hypothetical protein